MRRAFLLIAMAAGLVAAPALAKPVTDCPNRDTPFSASSPLIDLMLSPAAMTILKKHEGPTKLADIPSSFLGTRPPTFAAIVTLKEAAMFTGMKPEDIAAADAELRKLPVTNADRIARCARFDNDIPSVPRFSGKQPRLLLFEKINGFKDTPSVDAAHAALTAMAKRKGWNLVQTDKGGAFTPAILKRFDAVIWNNISGEVLTLSQRRALQDYLAQGGGFVGIHGSGGDPAYFWNWYPDKLIGARFAGHPMKPQFQEARVEVNKAHPLAKNLPSEWRMTDEWYSFKTNPRLSGANVVLSLDESTYSPIGLSGENLKMGEHPIAWTRCMGKGRMFYSAIGHLPQTYSEPHYVELLESALAWAAGKSGSCR